MAWKSNKATLRPGALALALLPAFGCVSPHWSREIVEGSADDVGRFASMHYHAVGFHKELRIVSENATDGRVVISRRSGTSESWGAFGTSIIDSEGARVPATAERPDGTLLVAYMKGGAPGGATGELWLATENDDSIPPWETELVRSGIRLEEPPAVAFERDAPNPSRIHIVYSLSPSRELWHAYRSEDDTTWTHLRVGASDMEPDESDVEGVHPLLVVSGTSDTVTLIYRSNESFGHRLLCWNIGKLLGFASWPLSECEITGGSFDALGGDEPRRVVARVVNSPSSPSHGLVGVVRAKCEGGLLAYFQSHVAPPYSWSGAVVPTIPTDTTRAFCYPSFAFDGFGLFYVSFYDADAGMLSVYKNHPVNPAEWRLETADSSALDVGRFTSMVYDPLAATILVAYYDVAHGDLKLASRSAN